MMDNSTDAIAKDPQIAETVDLMVQTNFQYHQADESKFEQWAKDFE